MEGFFFLQSPCGVVAVLILGEDSLDAAAQLRMKKERGGGRKKKKTEQVSSGHPERGCQFCSWKISQTFGTGASPISHGGSMGDLIPG